MNGAVVLFVGSPALHETRGGSIESFNWAWGVLVQHLLDKRATLLVCDGAAGPGDLGVRVARNMEIEWREYCADGWFYSERDFLKVGRWRHEGLPPASYMDRGQAIVNYVREQGKTRPVSVLALSAPWATSVELRPNAVLIARAVHEGLELLEVTCPSGCVQRAANG